MKRLVLRIRGVKYSFETPRDLEFALAGRCGLPPERLDALLNQPLGALLKDAENIGQMRKVLLGALDTPPEDMTSVETFIRTISPATLSSDHDWRAIIPAVTAADAVNEQFVRVALTQYVRYLDYRESILRRIYAHRQASAAVPSPASAPAPPRETLALELAPPASVQQAFTRIPKGKAVELRLEEGQDLPLLLAKHPFQIVHATGRFAFVGPGMEPHPLLGQPMLVGREPANDIVIDSNFRDVSRRHLLIEFDGTRLLRLTDLSSHGTSLPDEYLEYTVGSVALDDEGKA